MLDLFVRVIHCKQTEVIFQMYNIWHLVYLFVIYGSIVVVNIVLSKKSVKTVKFVLKMIAILMLVGYLSDIVGRSITNQALEKGKLPFHICTLMSIVIFVMSFFEPKWLKNSAVCLAIFAGTAFLLFPGTYPGNPAFSYTIVQTMLYHGFMVLWGTLMISTKQLVIEFKNFYQTLVALPIIGIWAFFGNEICYPDSLGENFMFLRKDLLFQIQAPYHLILYYGLAILLMIAFYGIFELIREQKIKKVTNKNNQTII